jgi:hypothetical protein
MRNFTSHNVTNVLTQVKTVTLPVSVEWTKLFSQHNSRTLNKKGWDTLIISYLLLQPQQQLRKLKI